MTHVKVVGGGCFGRRKRGGEKEWHQQSVGDLCCCKNGWRFMGVLYKENEGSDLRLNLIERERWRGVGCV